MEKKQSTERFPLHAALQFEHVDHSIDRHTLFSQRRQSQCHSHTVKLVHLGNSTVRRDSSKCAQ